VCTECSGTAAPVTQGQVHNAQGQCLTVQGEGQGYIPKGQDRHLIASGQGLTSLLTA